MANTGDLADTLVHELTHAGDYLRPGGAELLEANRQVKTTVDNFNAVALPAAAGGATALAANTAAARSVGAVEIDKTISAIDVQMKTEVHAYTSMNFFEDLREPSAQASSFGGSIVDLNRQKSTWTAMRGLIP